MPNYELIFRLDGELTDELVDDLYDSQLDCMVHEDHGGAAEIVVTAHGADVITAGTSVMSSLVSLGACPMELRPDLVDRISIAERAGVSRAAAGHWVRGDRGDGRFPETFADVSGGVWLWGDVVPWLRSNGHASDWPHSPTRQEHIRLSACVLDMRSTADGLIQNLTMPVSYPADSRSVADPTATEDDEFAPGSGWQQTPMRVS